MAAGEVTPPPGFELETPVAAAPPPPAGFEIERPGILPPPPSGFVIEAAAPLQAAPDSNAASATTPSLPTPSAALHVPPALAPAPPVSDGLPSATPVTGFWGNLTGRDVGKALREESLLAGLAKWITGNTDADAARRRQALGTDRDPVEDELNALAEQAYQAGGYDTDRYRQIDAALKQYRQARDNPEFRWADLMAAIKADPGASAAEFTKALIADPELLLTPLGWEKAALVTANAARALGAGRNLAAAAKVAGGMTGAAATAGAIEAPISVARQLGETGSIDAGRTVREVGTAAAVGGPAAGIFLGLGAGLRALRGLRAKPGADLAAIDAEIETLFSRTEAEAGRAGMSPGNARAALEHAASAEPNLADVVATSQGDVVRPRTDVLDALPGDTPPRDDFPKALPDEHPLLTPTHTIATPAREQLRTQIAADYASQAAPVEGRRPIAYIMAGGGGSGKSSVLRELQKGGSVPSENVVKIDPDAIKNRIPEFDQLRIARDSRAADVVHEESSQLAARIQREATAAGKDIILDKTLGDPQKARILIQDLKRAGYEVRLYGVTVDPETAIARRLADASTDYRFVPRAELQRAHEGFNRNFEDYARLADQAELFDNTAMPATPIAFKSPKDADLVPTSAEGYNKYVQRKTRYERPADQAEGARDAVPAGGTDQTVYPGKFRGNDRLQSRTDAPRGRSPGGVAGEAPGRAPDDITGSGFRPHEPASAETQSARKPEVAPAPRPDADELGRSTLHANPFGPALAAMARDIGTHTARSATQAFTGGVAGATLSEGEPGSAKWWIDVAAGTVGGVTLGQLLRRTHVIGKGSILDNWRVRAGNWIESLPLIGRGPEELRDLKAKQRLMRELLDRQTAEVGRQLLERFTPAERAMMADLIETRGIVKDLNVIHRQAQELEDYLVYATRKMKELGMLPEDIAEGGYLHRYYAKHLGLDSAFREAKRQSLSGSYSIARGTDDVFGRQYFSPASRAIVDEAEKVSKELERTENRKNPDGARIAELKARHRELRQTELTEYVGHQNGKLQSFFFARDEVPHVPGTKPETAGKLATGAEQRTVGGEGLADTHKPAAGEMDARLGPVKGIEDLKPTGRTWTVRGTKGDEALLHRDWTKAERKAWGEIDDAGYRYVRGMVEVSHDISLATFFERIARKGEWVSDKPRTTNGKDWIPVPDTKVGPKSPLRRYGALSGKYVRPDVWAGIRGHGRNPLRGGPKIPLTEFGLGDLYLGAVAKWKLYKTVYNPVTHFNNTFSNVETLYMSGYRPGDLGAGVKHMAQGDQSATWREARDVGLFGSDWTSSILGGEGKGNQAFDKLLDTMRTQPEIPDAALTTTLLMDLKHWWIGTRQAVAKADGAFASGAEIAKAIAAPAFAGLRFAAKPFAAAGRAMQRAYQFEDNLFKLAVFAAERKKGANAEQAAKTAQSLFYDYSDVPEAIKLARDLPVGSPFISYPYFAVQMLARNVAQNPERVLALVAAYEAMNYAALTADGLSPGEYWQVESAEETTSAPWDRGRSLWGARNTVHLPSPEGYKLALGRSHAVGNPFMTEAGGREHLPEVPFAANFWGSSVFGSSPLHAILDVSVNEDWKGKQIYKPGAPPAEKAAKISAYLYQAWTPSNPAMPGGYAQSRILEGMANDTRQARAAGAPDGVIAPVVDAANATAEALGFGQYTGEDRSGNPILTRDALLASFGVKLRPIQTEQAVDVETGRLDREKKKLADWFQEKVRLNADGRITDAQLDAAEQQLDAGLDALDREQDRFFRAEAFLQKRAKP